MKRLSLTILEIVITILLVSCSSSNVLTIKHTHHRYILKVPEYMNVDNFKDYHGYIEKRAYYDNGAVIYITDDVSTGGGIRELKISKYGNDIFLKIATKDSLELLGIDEDGRYWKELKLNKVIVGYYGVPKNLLKDFDSILLGLETK